MNGKGSFFVSLLILALGVAFIFLFGRYDIPKVILYFCGAAFVIPALISLVSLFSRKSEGTVPAPARFFQLISSVGGLVLGACVFLMPETFRGLLVYLFGALLIVIGVYQVYLLSRKTRPGDYPSWTYVMPLAALVAGVVLIVTPSLHRIENERWLVLVTGIGFVFFGLTSFIISYYNVKKRRETKRAANAAATEAKEQAKEIEDRVSREVSEKVSEAEKAAEAAAPAPAAKEPVVSAAHGVDAEPKSDVVGHDVSDSIH